MVPNGSNFICLKVEFFMCGNVKVHTNEDSFYLQHEPKLHIINMYFLQYCETDHHIPSAAIRHPQHLSCYLIF